MHTTPEEYPRPATSRPSPVRQRGTSEASNDEVLDFQNHTFSGGEASEGSTQTPNAVEAPVTASNNAANVTEASSRTETQTRGGSEAPAGGAAQERAPAPDLEAGQPDVDVGLTQAQHNVLVAEQMVKSQIFACVYCAPIVLAISVVLSREWGFTCDSFLQLWLFGVGALQVLRLPMRLVLVRRLMGYIHDEAQEDQWQAVLEEIRRSVPHMSLSFLNVVSLAWYLLGIVETMRSEDCEVKAPDTYKLSLALVIIFLVFLGFSCMCRLLYICLICFHHILIPPMPNNHPTLFLQNAGASEEVLNALLDSRFVFEGETQIALARADPEPVCAICLDEFKPMDEVSTLPCGHHFHYSEISQWLKDKRTCPLCNQEVTLTGLAEKENGDKKDKEKGPDSV